MEDYKARTEEIWDMKKKKNLLADEIADMADRGEDVTEFMGTPKKGGVPRTTLDLDKIY